MPIKSAGGIVSTKAAGDVWASPFAYDGAGAHPLAPYFRGAAYDEMYSQGLWPSVAVNKLTWLQVMLPGKTYRRRAGGREDAGASAFGRLMARPSTKVNPQFFWLWFTAMHHIHGKTFARKSRDGLGRPVELLLTHPTRMRYGPPGGGWVPAPASGAEVGDNRWWFTRPNGSEVQISRREFIYWPRFNPCSPMLGLSPLEPLRETLESEWATRRASRASWQNGGQHRMILKHPGRFNKAKVQEALAAQYSAKYGGPENAGKPLVLEEGMDAVAIPVDDRLQYVDTRRLNREEVAAGFDIPPPAIQILDRATFSNVTEQNRMLYRTTMPPHLTGFEAMIDFDLRDGSFGDGPPDFGAAFYFEWLADGALRGDFEHRIDAYAKAIQTGQMTAAEVRQLENRPNVEGTDTLLVNAALVPISEVSRATAATVNQPLPDDGTQVDEGVSTLGLAIEPAELLMPGMSSTALSTLMGRLSRPKTLDDVRVDLLVEGLDDGAADAVAAAMVLAKRAGSSVAQFRDAIKRLGI